MSARWAAVSGGVRTNLVELRGLSTLLVTEPRKLREELRKRPAFTLFASNIVAQVITLGLAPVLTRLYAPADFGVLGALTAVVVIVVPLLSLRYELALPRARDDRESLATMYVCAASIAIMTTVFTIAAWALLESFPIPALDPVREYIYVMPLVAAAAAVFEVLGLEASRRGAVGSLARSKLTQAIAGGGAQLGFGFMKLGALGLLLGFLVNQSAGITRLFHKLVLKHPAAGEVSVAQAKAAAIEHRDYPLYTSWSSSLDMVARWAVQIAITVYWDPKVGGFIFLADRVIGRPLLILSTALLPVFVAEFGRAIHEAPERLRTIFFASFRRQAAVSLLWTALVVSLAPLLFGPLFGPSWAAAVAYVQVMSLAIAPGTTLAPVGYTLQLLGRQQMESWMVVSKIALVTISLVTCYLLETSALVALALFAAVQLLHAVVKLAVYAHVVTVASHAPPPPPPQPRPRHISVETAVLGARN
jgi:O-antigen/teichoic acid export membrane protein